MIAMGVVLADGAGAAAGADRRPARAQHARAPACEARGDRGHLGHAGRRCRQSCSRWPDEKKRERTTSRSRSRSSASLYLTHDWDGEVTGLKAFARRTGRRSLVVLRLPDDGRHVVAHARAHRRELVLLARSAVRDALVPAALPGRSRSASSRCPPAGSRRKSGASRRSSTASCARPTPSRRRSPTHESLVSLALYVVVYAIVFGAGALLPRAPGPRRSRRADAARGPSSPSAAARPLLGAR